MRNTASPSISITPADSPCPSSSQSPPPSLSDNHARPHAHKSKRKPRATLPLPCKVVPCSADGTLMHLQDCSVRMSAHTFAHAASSSASTTNTSPCMSPYMSPYMSPPVSPPLSTRSCPPRQPRETSGKGGSYSPVLSRRAAHAQDSLTAPEALEVSASPSPSATHDRLKPPRKLTIDVPNNRASLASNTDISCSPASLATHAPPSPTTHKKRQLAKIRRHLGESFPFEALFRDEYGVVDLGAMFNLKHLIELDDGVVSASSATDGIRIASRLQYHEGHGLDRKLHIPSAANPKKAWPRGHKIVPLSPKQSIVNY